MKIFADIFPAHVAVVPEGQIDNVFDLKSDPPTKGSHYVGTTRVIVHDEGVMIAADSPEGAKIIFREAYSEYHPGEKQDTEHRIITVSGKMLSFKKDTNCGCGSRLRSWNPYRTLNSIKD